MLEFFAEVLIHFICSVDIFKKCTRSEKWQSKY